MLRIKQCSEFVFLVLEGFFSVYRALTVKTRNPKVPRLVCFSQALAAEMRRALEEMAAESFRQAEADPKATRRVKGFRCLAGD